MPGADNAAGYVDVPQSTAVASREAEIGGSIVVEYRESQTLGEQS